MQPGSHIPTYGWQSGSNIQEDLRIAGATALNGVHYHAHPVGVAPNCLKVCILTDCSHTHASRVFSGLCDSFTWVSTLITFAPRVAAQQQQRQQQWQRTARLNRSSNTQPTLDLTLAFRSHNNSFCITIRTLTSRLYIRTTWVSQTPPALCAFLKFEFLHSQCR